MISVDSNHLVKPIGQVIKSFFFNLCSYNSYNTENEKPKHDSIKYHEN